MIICGPSRQPRSAVLRDAAAGPRPVPATAASTDAPAHLVAGTILRHLVVPAVARARRGAVAPIVAPPTRRAPGQRRPPPPGRH
ncbi:hypothetical protein ACGF7U_14945 [Micromonospora sp. NPDC047670]|uniref:hypothetical protein n=1 Tax=Micromonospora sp. NPDC047670 TaxID=3364252 RepID=UPI0037195B6C